MGAEALSGLAARLRELPKLGASIARESAPSCQAIARETAAAGTTPDGAPWAPRKSDGGRALVNAAAAITARAVDDVVMLVLAGVNVFHNPTRRILPDTGAGVPRRYVDAIRTAARRVVGGAL